MAVRADREKSKMQEKYQIILAQMLREEDNRYCVDCDMKSPRWASWNIGIFICIRCAGFHRNLGVHISKVKSVNLDSWTGEQIASMQAMGNSRARAVYEANLPDGFRRPQIDSALDAFIRAKYEQRKWIAKEWIPPEISRMEAELNQQEIIAQVRQQRQEKTISEKKSDVKPLTMPVPTNNVITEDLLNLDEPSIPPAKNQQIQSTILDPLHDLFLPPNQPHQQETLSSPTNGPMTKEKILALFNTPSPYPSMVQSPTFPSAMNYPVPPKSPSFNNYLYQHQLNPSMMSFANQRNNASATTFFSSMPMRPVSEYMPTSTNTFWQ